MQIDSKTYGTQSPGKFSILIPTWNNLEYLKLCVESLRNHSEFEHQLIVHINDGSDGSKEWVEAEQIDHSWSADNVGVCHALNAAAQLAQTDYIAFFNDDMYALPGWDSILCAEIDTISHDRWFLSGTMIEPTETGNPCVIAPHDFGRSADSLDVERLLRTFGDLPKADWSGGTWPPNVVPRSLWEEVGGYSEEFSPGMSSDPDFSMKLWDAGVRYFKGMGQSRVYHFQAKSTGKVKKNNGGKQFLDKWKITQGSFGKLFLRRGTAWDGPLPEAGPGLWRAKLKAFFKRLF